MSLPTSACCVVFLNQQQQNAEEYNQSLNNDQQSLDDEEVNQPKTKSKNCTVVENGLVVVKPSCTTQRVNKTY